MALVHPLAGQRPGTDVVVEVGLPESESIYIPTTFLILPLLPLAYEGSESMKQDRTSRQNHFSEPRKKKKILKHKL